MLNFNKKGNTHNTLIGGLCSIFVNMFLFFYVYTLIDKLVNMGDDKITILNQQQDYQKLGSVKYGDMSTLIYP